MTTPQAFQLALQHHEAGRLEEAEALYRQIHATQPDHAEALHMLGVLALQRGQNESAVALINQAIALDANTAGAYSNLGAAYRALGRLEEAATAHRRAIQLQPGHATAHYNLALVLGAQGRIEEAVEKYSRALELKADFAEAAYNLGNAFRHMADEEKSIAAYRHALELRPNYLEAQNNLAHALEQSGQVALAVAAYRRALQLRPDLPAVHSNLIHTLHFAPGVSRQDIATEQHLWNQQFSGLRTVSRRYGNDRSPDRRLRIGYSSPNFRANVVGLNVAPLFKEHNHHEFEIVCYSDGAGSDEMTDFLRRHADLWRATAASSDEALAAMIEQDRVDILVDLTQHMAGNRLPVFARQPAPIQVSFAGYPETTGVEAIEYRISDKWMECGVDHPDVSSETSRGSNSAFRIPQSEFYNERLHLLDSFWCYDPFGAGVPVNPLPAVENGRITFGNLNNFRKINEPLLKLWALVLKNLPHSKLILASERGRPSARIVELLEKEGVEAGRVAFVSRCSREEYLKLHHRLDIMLDTFPYNGHSTSLDALWMGVPVVSLCSESPVSRAGLSQLSNLGLPELVAHSPDEFVQIATRLAGNLSHLAELRRTLRSRMEASFLMNATHFARQIEAAFRAMWRRWCDQPRQS